VLKTHSLTLSIMSKLIVGGTRDREKTNPQCKLFVFLCFSLDIICTSLTHLFELFVSIIILCIYMFLIDKFFPFKNTTE
jgi:hypothetical protein